MKLKFARDPILSAVLATGFSGVITQIVLMREFLSVFSGNELVLGIILGNWFFLTGAGSYAGRYSRQIKNKVPLLISLLLLTGILSPLSIFFVRSLRSLVFSSGDLIGIGQIFFSTFLILLPYCLAVGIILTMSPMLYSDNGGPGPIGKTYFADVTGDIAGGLLLSFFLLFLLNPLQILVLVATVSFISAAYLAFCKSSKALSISIVLLAAFIMPLFFVSNLNRISIEKMFPGQQLQAQKTSIYGNLVVTKRDNQLNFFENGVPLFSTENTLLNEEKIHFPLLQLKNPCKVLLVSGGVSGTIAEILKHNVTRIDYVELDHALISLGRRFTENLNADNLRTISTDGRFYIKFSSEKYDAIIIDLPPPESAQINRYYTTEFFREAKRILKPHGILSFATGTSSNYYGRERKMLNSALAKSVKAVFKNLIVVPGNQLYMITSDRELTTDYNHLLMETHIQTSFINKNYLRGILTRDRTLSALETLKEKTGENRDFRGIAYYFQLLSWLKYFETGYLWALLPIAILLLLFITKVEIIPFSVFICGLSSSALSVIVLISFQIAFGSIYHRISVLITSFMIGVAIGALFINKRHAKINHKTLTKIIFTFSLFSFILPFLLSLLAKGSGLAFLRPVTEVAYPVMNIVIGALTGALFPTAAKLHFKTVPETAASIYSADFFGAALGAITVSALLIPILGITKVAFLIGSVNLSLALALRIKGINRKHAFNLLALAVFALFGYGIFRESSNETIYRVSTDISYIRATLIFLFFSLLILLFSKRLFRNQLEGRFLSLLGFFTLALIVFYPIFRCFFRIPYLFCHTCPQKCAFGIFRPVLIPMALILNLERKFWCNSLCPVGFLTDTCMPLKLSFPRVLRNLVRPLILIFVVISYFLIKFSKESTEIEGSNFFLYLYRSSFSTSTTVIAIAIILYLASFIFKRFWCQNLCPHGTASEYIARFINRLNERKPGKISDS